MASKWLSKEPFLFLTGVATVCGHHVFLRNPKHFFFFFFKYPRADTSPSFIYSLIFANSQNVMVCQ